MLLLPHWDPWQHELDPLKAHLTKIGWVDPKTSHATEEGVSACVPGGALFLHFFEAIEAAISLAQSLESSWVSDKDFRDNLRSNLLATRAGSSEDVSGSDIDFAVRYLLSSGVLQLESITIGKRAERCLKLGPGARWNAADLKIDFSDEVAEEVRFLCWCAREIRVRLDNGT